MLSHRLQAFLTRFDIARVPKRRGKRALRRSRRHANAFRQPRDCRSVEALEDRVLLSATPLETPTFILEGKAPAPGTAAPATSTAAQPATAAPITPAQMQAAYGVNLISFGGVQGTGQGQTIALIDAYNDPNIISDAEAFSAQFGLPQFNVSGGPTLQVLNEFGGTSLPSNPQFSGTWDVEESLDVEWAHAIAPQANIILFEASTAYWGDLAEAEQTAAATPGVSVVSNSWGGGELPDDTTYDSTFLTPAGHQGVTFLASAGDYRTPALYPAYSPNVVAVGGTTLNVDSSGDYLSESAWADGGGGISVYEPQAAYQTGKVGGVNSTQRIAPDISMDADPNTGVDVLDTFYSSSYLEVGGTSLSCPMMAGLIAVANQGRVLNGLTTLDGPTQTLPALYDLAGTDLHDITTGNNGWAAGPGYDLATGLGTPVANLLVPALASYQSTVTSPHSIIVYGMSPFAFSDGSITVNDPAATGNSDSLTLSVSNGELTLGSTTGLTFVSGANGTASITVTGTQTNLNAALDGLVYTPTGSYEQVLDDYQDFLQVSVHDANNNQTSMASVNITVAGPPAIDATSTLGVQGGSHVDSGFFMEDAAAAGSSDSLTLSVGNGNLTLSLTTGLTITAGSNSSPSMTVTGTLENLNYDIINGLVYTPNAGFIGADSLQITLANSIDNLSGSATVQITVYSALAILIPPNWSTNGGFISVVDPAASGNSDSLTVSETHGTVGTGWTTGLTFTSGSNNSSSFTVNGTLENLDLAVGDLGYAPNYGYVGPDTLQLSLADAANKTSTTVSIPVTVTASLPQQEIGVNVLDDGVWGVTEDGFNFPIVEAVRLADSDPVGNSDSLTLSATNGTISFGYLPSDLTVTGGAEGSSSVTLTGPFSDLVGLVNTGIRYTPDPGYLGPDWLKVSLDNSEDGLSASNTLVINVLPGVFVYAPPIAYVAENDPYTFSSGIGVIDAHAVGNSDSLTLDTSQGSLTLASTTGLTFTSGSNGSSSMTVTGSVADLNAALDGLVFSTGLNFVGSQTLDITADDTVDGWAGGSRVSIRVNPLPSVTAPTAVSLNENSSYSFSSGSLQVADPAEEAYDSLSLFVSDGTLLLASTTGLSFSSGSNGSSSMTVTGVPGSLSAALNGLVYAPNAGYGGPDSLQISLIDPDDTFSAAAAVAIAVQAPPTVTVTDAGGTYNGNPYNATGTVAGVNGVPGTTLGGVGLTFTYYAGTTATGTPLSGAPTNVGTYTVVASFAGSEYYTPGSAQTTFTITTAMPAVVASDAGGRYTGNTHPASATATGVGGVSVSGSFAFTYYVGTSVSGTGSSAAPSAVGTYTVVAAFTSSNANYANAQSSPVTFSITPAAIGVSAPSTASVYENVSLIFSAAHGNAITVTDGAGSGIIDSLTLTVTHGTLTLAATSGLTVSSGSNGSASVTVSGTLSSLNAALAGLTYTPAKNYTGSDALQISISDSGDSQSATATVSLTVAAATPTLTYPTGLVRAYLNAPVTFMGTIYVTDPVAGNGVEQLALSATHGVLTLGSTSGITIISGANSSSAMTITGTVAKINAALNGLMFTPTPNYMGTADISISCTDLGDGLTTSGVVVLYYSRILSSAIVGSPAITSPTSVTASSSTASPSVAANTATSQPTSTATPQTDEAEDDSESTTVQWSGLTAALAVLNG